MSEKDRTKGSVDDIEEQIRKLEKEKEELEQRLQLLQDNVTQLKSGPNSRDNRGTGRNVTNRNRDSGDLNSSFEESQARLRSLQQSVLNSSLGGVSSVADDSQEDRQRSSDDADELDDVMSMKHKQALRINRDVLVENMTPDDIFNDLISKHILTNSDVSRIKEKNTTEAINEELLNVLIRRSDKAFYVFVTSLRRTLQGWLANRLDPNSQPTNKRRRRTGEMNVNIDCERIVPARNKRFTCTCQEVEEQILQMAKGAFAHIRRRDASPAAFEQFRKEIQQTNIAIKESMEIRNTLKELCRHGDIVDLSEGSVCFTIKCASLASCLELWDRYHSGHLLDIFQKNLVNPFLLRICGASEIHLCLRISRVEFLTCALELAYKERDRLLDEMNFRKVTPIKRRLRKHRLQDLENMHTLKMRKSKAFVELSSNGSPSRPNLVGNITLSDNKLRSQDPECTSIVPVKFCPEMVSPSSFAHHSMAQSVALKNATKLKTKITTDFSNGLVKKEELPQTKFRRPCVQKDFCTSCPYNLRYRILAS